VSVQSLAPKPDSSVPALGCRGVKTFSVWKESGNAVRVLCLCKATKAQSKPTNTVEAFMLLTARCTGYRACAMCVDGLMCVSRFVSCLRSYVVHAKPPSPSAIVRHSSL
jgi:hypothetical protein